ncbi:unnamed protein product [Sympodiomycopsis kandeliae]
MRVSISLLLSALAIASGSGSLVANAEVSPRGLENSIKNKAYHAANGGAHQAADAAVYGKHQVKHAGNKAHSQGDGADDYAHDQAQSAEDYIKNIVGDGDDDTDSSEGSDDSDDSDEGASGREQGEAAEAYAHDQAAAAQDHADRETKHHQAGRGSIRNKSHKSHKPHTSIYDEDYTPGVIASASHWLETKTAAYAYPRALSTALSSVGAGFRGGYGSFSQGSGNAGGLAIAHLASSYAGIPNHGGKNDRFASATARAKPTFLQPQQQQQRPLAAPARRPFSSSSSLPSDSTRTESASGSSTPVKRGYGAYHDIGDVYASRGTQQATDAVSSVSDMLYGNDYAYGLDKREMPAPSPTTAAAAPSVEPEEEKAETNSASKTRGGAPYYGREICLMACVAAVFAGALL